jgi:hypothetical protein
VSAADRLTEMRARVEAATEGPWRTRRHRARNLAVTDEAAATFVAHYTEPDNAEFIAAARADVPVLVAAVEGVLALHTRRPWSTILDSVEFDQQEFPDQCNHCRQAWPCATVRAVQDALGGES